MGNNCSNRDEGTAPPPIPPKPHIYNNSLIRNQNPTSDNAGSNAKKGEQEYVVVNYEEKLVGDPKPIGELVAEFSTYLPMCFSVSESLYGICGESSLMEGQLLHVHFLKDMKVLLVRAKNSSVEYNLPLCSTVQISVLYDPNNRSLQAKRGSTFNKAADLMNAEPLPKIVCALVGLTDLRKNEIEANTILHIEQLHDEEDRKFLICSDADTGELFNIDETCEGKFTTAPDKIRMSISKVLGLVTLPIDVTVSSPVDGSIVLPSSALNCVYTIAELKEEKSVIASTKYTSEDGSKTSNQTIEIFLDVPIEVQLVELRSRDIEVLRKESRALHKNFHSSKVSKVICDLDSSINVIQTELYKAIKTSGSDSTDMITLHNPMAPGLRQDSEATLPPDDQIYDTMGIDGEDDEEYVEMDTFKQTQKSNTAPLPRKLPHVSPKIKHSPNIPSSLRQSPRPSKSLTTDSSLLIPGRFQKRPPIQTKPAAADTIAPYLVARRQNNDDDSMTHERPYDYVKFSPESRDREIVALKKELERVRNENQNVYGQRPVSQGKRYIITNITYHIHVQ